jgi:gliding motility-associated-like protein
MRVTYTKLLSAITLIFLSFLTHAQQTQLVAVQRPSDCGATTILVDVIARNVNNVNGVSHVLEWNDPALTIINDGVVEKGLSSPTFNFNNTNRTLTVVWAQANLVSFNGGPGGANRDSVLYTITFNVNGGLAVNSMLSQQAGNTNNRIASNATSIPYTFVPAMFTLGSNGTDTTPPTVSGCPNTVNVTTATGATTATATWTEPTATDNCQVANITKSHTPGASFPIGTTAVTYTFRDASGNSSTCTFSVVVTAGTGGETGGGISTGAQLIAVQRNANCGASTILVDIIARNVNNVNGISHLLEWNDPALTIANISERGLTSATLNSNNDNRTLTVVWATPNLVSFNGTNRDSVLYTITFNVNGGLAANSMLNQRTSNNNKIAANTTEIAYTFVPTMITLNAGSGTDTTPPVVSNCPGTINVSTPSGATTATATWVEPTATDDCQVATISKSHIPGASFPIGTTAVTYTFTDASGNSSTCTFNVVVTAGTGGGTGGGMNTGAQIVAVQRNANCGASTIIVDVIARNINNVNGISHVLEWNDPALTILTDGVVERGLSSPTFNINNANRTLTVVWAQANLVSFNGTNRDSVLYTITFNVNGGLATNSMLNQRAGSNNKIAANANEIAYTFLPAMIKLGAGTDTTPPVVSNCPGVINVNAPMGTTSAVATWTEPTATDNCQVASITKTHTPGTSFPIGTTQVTYTFTDASGNSATCIFNVVVTAGTGGGTPITGPRLVAVQRNAPCGATTITVDIIAKEINNVNGISHVLQWNDAALTIPTDGVVERGLSSPTFNVNNTNRTLTVVWAQAGLVSFNGGTGGTNRDSILYTISFNVAGSLSTNAMLTQPINSNNRIASNATELAYTFVPTAIRLPSQEECDKNATTIRAVQQSTPCGSDTIKVDIIARNVTNVNGFSQVIEWNDPALQIDTVIERGLTSPTFNINNANRTLTVVWAQAGLVSFNGGTGGTNRDSVLYTIVFKVNGNLANNARLSQQTGTNNRLAANTVEVPYAFTGTPLRIDQDNQPPVVSVCPSNITILVAGDKNTATVNWTYPTVTDDCGIVDTLGYVGNSGVFPIGETLVRYIFVDRGGNRDTCSFTVKVDTLAVGITCPSNVIASVGNRANDCTGVVNNIAIVGLANSGAVRTTSYSFRGATIADSTFNGIINASGRLFNKDTTMVTYRVVDTLGNSASCSFRVILRDNTAPRFECPKDTLVRILLGDTIAVVENIGLAALRDNCTPRPIVRYELSGATRKTGMDDASGEIFNIGTTKVTYFVRDNAGNIDSCSFNVQVLVNLIDIQCPKDTTVFVSMDTCSKVVNNIGVSITNLGALASMSYRLEGATRRDSTAARLIDASGLMFNKDTTVVTYTIRDTISMIKTCSFSVIVKDTIPPVIQCPARLLVNIPDGQNSINVTGTQLVSIMDNCDNMLNVSYRITGATTRDSTGMGIINANGFFNRGMSTVTYRVSDRSRNTATCSFEVEVRRIDTLTLQCPKDTTVFKLPNICQTIVQNINARVIPFDQVKTISYRLSGATIFTSRMDTITQASGQAFNVGETNLTYTLISLTNDTLRCTSKVTVRDTLGVKFLNCPKDTTIFATEERCSFQVNWMPPTLSDTCAMPTVTASRMPMDTFMLGTTRVVYTVMNQLGFRDTCSFNITIRDTIPPTFITCPSDVVLNATDNCTARHTWIVPQATDNCRLDSVVSNFMPGFAFPLGTTEVIYRALDASGNARNCTFKVTVLDSLPLAFVNCPANITLEANNNCEATATWTPPTIQGACTSAQVTSNFMPGATFPLGTTRVIYIATSSTGSADTCSFEVVVVDRTPPTLICPENIVIGTQTANCDAPITWNPPVIIDNCDIDTIFSNFRPGDNFSTGTTEVIYTAIDQSGNVGTCTFTITIEQQETTVMNCPMDITLNADEGACGRRVNWTPPAFENPCSEFTVESNFTPGDFFPVGMTEVIYRVTDKRGNVTICRFNVNILDTQRPTFTNCPTSVVLSATNGCTAVHTWRSPTVRDNCEVTRLDSTHTSGMVFPVGETVVRYTATDASGNVQICEFTIRVNDSAPPVFTNCPDTIKVRIDGTLISDPSRVLTAAPVSNQCSSVRLSFNAPIAEDACGEVSVVKTDGTGLNSGSTFPVGTTTLVYTAVDISGNRSICQLVIQIIDLPAINITVDNAQPCENTQITLTASEVNIPNAQYRWIGAGIQENGRVISVNSSDIRSPGIISVAVNQPNGCVLVGEVTINAQQNPRPTITHNDILCVKADATLRLRGENLANNNIVTWTWSGPNGFSSDQQEVIINNITSANSGLYRLTAVSAAGCEGRTLDTILITPALERPTVSVTTDDNVFCEGDEVRLIGQPFQDRAVSYRWVVVPDTGDVNLRIDSTNTNVATATLTKEGTYNFLYWVAENGCTSDTITTTVNVGRTPRVDAAFIGELDCASPDSIIQFFELGGDANRWVWTGPNNFRDSTQNPILSNVNSAASGTYTVIGELKGCTSSAQIELDFSGSVPMPAIQPITRACSKDTISLTILGNYDEGVLFTWQIPSVSNVPITTMEKVLKIVPNQVNTIRASVFASKDGCTSALDSISFTTIASPIVDLSTVVTEYACIGQDSLIQLNETGGNGVKWDWTGPDAISGGFPSLSFVVNAQNAQRRSGRYFVTVLGNNGCETTDFVDIDFFRGLTDISITGANRYCVGETIMLTANGEIIDSIEYSWNGPNQFKTGGQTIILEAQPLQTGIYTVIASARGCNSKAATIEISVVASPIVELDQYQLIINKADTLDVLANDNLIQGVPITFGLTKAPFLGTAEINAAGDLIYISDKIGIDNLNYEVCYQGCLDPNRRLCEEGIATIQVKYPDELCIITNVVTPNDDGKNDFLIITCVEGETYPNNELIILSQWGDEVFRASPYNNDWNGTYNGSKLPDGTYFYLFKSSPTADAQKGFITLYR